MVVANPSPGLSTKGLLSAILFFVCYTVVCEKMLYVNTNCITVYYGIIYCVLYGHAGVPVNCVQYMLLYLLVFTAEIYLK